MISLPFEALKGTPWWDLMGMGAPPNYLLMQNTLLVLLVFGVIQVKRELTTHPTIKSSQN